MKKILFILIAVAFFSKVEAQAPVGTILWSESWTGGTPSESISEYGFEGTVVYNNFEIKYERYDNERISTSSNAGGPSPELYGTCLVAKNIPTGGAPVMQLQLKRTGGSNNFNFHLNGGGSFPEPPVQIANNKWWIYNSYRQSSGGFFIFYGTIGAQIWGQYIDDIELKVIENVELPIPNYGSGVCYQPFDLELSCATPNAIIHYSTDGNTPNENSPIYTTPIHVQSDMTIKAVAYKNGMPHSVVNTLNYSFQQYDLEIGEIYYDIISLSDLTLCAVGMVDSQTTILEVPETVEYGNRLFTVTRVDIHASCESVEEIILPENLDYLYIGRCNVEELHLNAKIIDGFNNCQRLKKLFIGVNVEGISNTAFQYCKIDKLVLEDGNSTLNINESFSFTSIDTLYCGRNLIDRTNKDNFWPLEECGISVVEYGPLVERISGYMLNNVEHLVFPENVDFLRGFNGSALKDISIESKDFQYKAGYGLNDELLTYCNSLIRVYSNAKYSSRLFENMSCEQFIIGPDVTHMGGSNNIAITGNDAFVKVFNRTPPLLSSTSFTNDTYLHTPLYVPRGSMNAYQTQEGWRNFFNIIEFDWDGPYYTISAMVNNSETGETEGSGIYHYGETASLKAHSYNGYSFLNWTEEEDVISIDSIYTFVVDRDRTLVANFGGTGIDENKETSKICAFVKDKMIMIEGVEGFSEVSVYNMSGQRVYQGAKKKFFVPCSGLYIVVVENKRIKVVVK